MVRMTDEWTRGRELSYGSLSRVVGEISEWITRELPSARTEMIRETLEVARTVFASPRVLMVWEEADEPWINTAYLENANFAWKQSAPLTYEPMVSERLRDASFFFMSQHGGTDQHDPIHPALRKDFRIESGLAVLLDGETTGRLLILDIEPLQQHFLIAPIVASIIESRFSRFTFQENGEQDEVALRIRSITRDLHDGLLQSFTGIVLQLENLLPLLESDPDEARRQVTDIEGVLMNEQRELRSYLESLSEKERPGDTDFDMTGRLRDLAARYHDQWGVEVECRRNVLDPVVRSALGWETYRIITESITNAAKHGNAKHVKVALATNDDRLVITVQDDGDGFPFRGRLNSDEMTAQSVAPTSLTERVRALNGDVSIESTDEGSLVEISIPIGWSQV